MDAQEFAKLVNFPESESLDFKRELWHLDSEEGVTDFVKDVICMANTVHDENAYIIIGIGLSSADRDMCGVDFYIDDANLQQMFEGRVRPVPAFNYETVEYSGKTFGVIAIPPAQYGPCMPLKDLPAPGRQILRRGNVYIRRGSRNSIAESDEIIRFATWLHRNNSSGVRRATAFSSPEWERLVDAVHKFEPTHRYTLISTNLPSGPHHDLPALASVPWVSCIDLDPKSETGGLLGALREPLSNRRSVYTLTAVDPLPPGGANATYWLFARGLEGRQEAPESSNYRKWVATLQANLSGKVSQIAAMTLPTPMTTLVLAYQSEMVAYVRAMVEMMLSAYGEAIELIIATDDTAAYSNLASDFDLPLIDIPLGHLSSGLAALRLEAGATTSHRLPSSSGAPVSLNPADTQWIEEELEILYLDAGMTPHSDLPVGNIFLRGGEADWYDLALHSDVDRDKYHELRAIVEQQLTTRNKTTRSNLYHLPGAGGSTLSRRILWDLHRTYPSALLLQSNPPETVERLSRIYGVTDQPILLVADSGKISERTLDDLFESLRARQVPVAILQVIRRFSSQRQSALVRQLEAELTDGEAGRFVEIYSRDQPNKRLNLDRIATSHNKRERTAFHFGLAAFGKEYKGLGRYVAARVEGLNNIQRSILVQIAIAHHYAQQPLPAQVFANMLGVKPTDSVDLASILPEHTRDLLIETEAGWWRTAHDLFASELIERHMADPQQPWRNSLSVAAIALAETCRGSSRIPSSDLLEIARRIFIYRDNADLLGTERAGVKQFAKIIEDLPSPNAGVQVLTKLTDLYPDETHFAAHLARLLAFKIRDFDQATHWIGQAIDESEHPDPVLYHMRGMILRERVYELVKLRRPMEELVDFVEAASMSFERARTLRPDNEHGYISEAQMLIKFADYARSVDKSRAGLVYSTGEDNVVPRAMEHTEDLLAQVRRMREGREESTYEAKCRAELDSLYGDHDSSVQTYLGLLDRDDVPKTSLRRGLIWMYLRHRGRRWTRLRRKEIVRIVSLLESNIQEEPDNDSNQRLWIQAIRQLPESPSLDAVIEQVSYWKDVIGSLDSLYYLYVVNALRAMEGSRLAFDQFERYRTECARRAWTRRDRTRSVEWLGPGSGVKALIHQSELGEWDEGSQFYTNAISLARLEARVSGYEGPQAGKLVLVDSGLEAFYVPARVGHSRRSSNRRVTCHIGFSYDGLRAWNVLDLPL